MYTPAEMANDEEPYEVNNRIEQLFIDWGHELDEDAYTFARDYVEYAENAISKQLLRKFRAAGALVEFGFSQKLDSIVGKIVEENVQLIKSIAPEMLDRVRDIVEESIRVGGDLNKITTELERRFEVTESRAKTIAYDQTNKITESISRVRATDLGFNRGIWIHRGGSNTPRPTHVEFDGMEFNINDGLYDIDEGEMVVPGQLVNCKCTFALVLEGYGDAEKQDQE